MIIFEHPPGLTFDLGVRVEKHDRQIGQPILRNAVKKVTIWKQMLWKLNLWPTASRN